MLSQAQIERFHADGYLIMRGLFSGEELSRLQAASDAVIAEGRARIDEENHRYLPGPDGDLVYWRSESLWARDPVFRAITVNPELLENIGQCVGTCFYPWNDSLVVKVPRSGPAVAWHQDPPYRSHDRESTFPVPNFTTDIYLDHSGPDNGCVYAIPGHHLVGYVDLTSIQEDLLYAAAVPLEMEPGDALFHCLSTPHGSPANLSGRQRRVVYLHYLAEEVYVDSYLPEPWAKNKPGWCADRRELCEQMLADRRSIGLKPASSPLIEFCDSGFRFTGAPATRPGYWSELAAAIPESRRRELKALGIARNLA